MCVCAVCQSVCLSVRQPASQSVSLSIGNEYNLACMLSVTASSMPVGIGRRRDDRSVTMRATTLVLTSKSFSSMQKACRSRGAQLAPSRTHQVQTRPQGGGGSCSCRHLWYGYICESAPIVVACPCPVSGSSWELIKRRQWFTRAERCRNSKRPGRRAAQVPCQ